MICYLKTILARLLKIIAILVGKLLWPILNFVIPKSSKLVAISTFPDFDDTARAMIEALSRRGMSVVILLSDKSARAPIWAQRSNVRFIHRYSIQGILYYHRSSIIFFTHGIFSRYPVLRRKIIVNLWHGMPIKRIGLMDGKSRSEVPQFDYTIAADCSYRSIIAASFGVSEDRVFVMDHPRTDILKGMYTRCGVEERRDNLVCVWLPTYRQSVVGDCRADGLPSGDVLNDPGLLNRFDKFFRENAITCIAKPHPMAPLNADRWVDLNNIHVISDAYLVESGISLYELLSTSDFLITDVSSVYVDYKTLNRPIVLYCPDILEYEKSRGFSAPIFDLVKHDICISEEQFERALLKAKYDALVSLSGKNMIDRDISASDMLIEKILNIAVNA